MKKYNVSLKSFEKITRDFICWYCRTTLYNLDGDFSQFAWFLVVVGAGGA
jgi:hypothetical protein